LPIYLDVLPLPVLADNLRVAIMLRKIKPAKIPERLFTVFALADAVKVSAVVHLWEAYHIEEHTIQWIFIQGLFQDFQEVILLLASHHTGVYLAVVVDMLALFADIETSSSADLACCADTKIMSIKVFRKNTVYFFILVTFLPGFSI
jgi:hypothetical protein